MTRDVQEIIKTAKRLNACDIISQITDIKTAIGVLLTPQGREFVQTTKYPSLDTFRENKANFAEMENVYVDSGYIFTDNHNIVAVGNSDVTLCAFGTEALYHVLAMYGARVRIDARDYAVVTATSVDGNIEYTNDGTAVIATE